MHTFVTHSNTPLGRKTASPWDTLLIVPQKSSWDVSVPYNYLMTPLSTAWTEESNPFRAVGLAQLDNLQTNSTKYLKDLVDQPPFDHVQLSPHPGRRNSSRHGKYAKATVFLLYTILFCRMFSLPYNPQQSKQDTIGSQTENSEKRKENFIWHIVRHST